MASALSGLLGQTRTHRSESTSKGLQTPVNELADNRGPRQYPSSINRIQRNVTAPATYRSMLNVEDPPSLSPISVNPDESMENWAAERLSQAAKKHTARNSDWADILCFYTAANGVAAPPTRASPAPATNGKPPGSPEQIPQSVSSSDPKIAAQQASDMKNIVRRKLTGYVGFANLPNQWHRKSVRKGFNFNVMVVGKFQIGVTWCLPLTYLR